jgi:hypothetical protein
MFEPQRRQERQEKLLFPEVLKEKAQFDSSE